MLKNKQTEKVATVPTTYRFAYVCMCTTQTIDKQKIKIVLDNASRWLYNRGRIERAQRQALRNGDIMNYDVIEKIKEVLGSFNSKFGNQIGNTRDEVDYLIATIKYRTGEVFKIVDHSKSNYVEEWCLGDMSQCEKDIDYILENEEDKTIQIWINFQCDAYYNAYKINASIKEVK